MTPWLARRRADLARLQSWWAASRPGRALRRYGQANGAVLCGGIAYSAIFSLFAGLTIGYTAFMMVLGNDATLRASVLGTLDRNLPGLIDTGDGSGIVSPDTLVLSTSLSWAGLAAVVVLLWSAVSCMAAIRSSVQAMFGIVEAGDSTVVATLRELAGLVGVGLAVLVAAVAGVAVNGASRWLLDWLGVTGSSRVLLPALGFVVSFLVDAAVFVLIVVVLAGVRPARRPLLEGAALAALALGVVRVLGTSVVAGSAGANPVLASFAVIVTLLVWINLFARITLTAAAFAADPPAAELELPGRAPAKG